jgi:CRISPR-associated endoribonuclease Cas6
MRFKITLYTQQTHPQLTLNYQYPLSAAIYKIIQRADAAFSEMLHNTGYGQGHKSFKLFTFSDLSTIYTIQGDRMLLKSDTASFIICFYIPQAAENFIKGLFAHQQLEIADSKSKVVFGVQQVESQADSVSSPATNTIKKALLSPLSPLVVGRKNDRGHYDYRSPQDADFTDCLLYNWLEKYRAVYNAPDEVICQLQQQTNIQTIFYHNPPRERKPIIKAGTPEQTKLRGYNNFRLHVTAPSDMLELAMSAGLGLYNAQGMGCVGVV